MTVVMRILYPLLVSLCALCVIAPARAASSPFDLAGPQLHVAVTHDGTTLPIEWVPNLSEGDRISVKLDTPEGRTTRYRLIAAFLRGATERPPKDWFHDAKTWKEKNNGLSLIVPAGARQMVLFLMPEDGGDLDAVVDAVRDKPGTFVRATQELNQAALDRARLDAFLRNIRSLERDDPNAIADASKALTQSLAIKLKSDCLQQPVDLQAPCLTDDRESMLLSDSHSSSLTSTLVGAPTDLAFQLSATPQGNYGYYSPYIGVVRDIFRIFGAFQSTTLQYVPALAQLSDGRGKLLLNSPLSFGKPTSVMVAVLPAIEPPNPPPLRLAHPDRAFCAASGSVLPVEGAPLVYATHYARDMALRLTREDGSQVDLPVTADARRGGFVIRGAVQGDGFGPAVAAQLHGTWGFTRFEGPQLTLSDPDAGAWQAPSDASLIVGRDNELRLHGGPAGCVSSIEMRPTAGPAQPIKWSAGGAQELALTLLLTDAAAGPVTIVVNHSGQQKSQILTLPALDQVGHIASLTYHAGDDRAVLTGTRLDQVRSVKVGGVAFRPGDLSREGDADRLSLIAIDSVAAKELGAGRHLTAEIGREGGRDKKIAVTVAPDRPQASLVSLSARSPSREDVLPMSLRPSNIVRQDARLTFAFTLAGGARLNGRETIELASADGRATTSVTAGQGYDLQDEKTGIVSLTPADSMGPFARGDIRFRVVGADYASDWAALASLVRVPEIKAVNCASGKDCTLTGDRLFLISKIAENDSFTDSFVVPDGFTANRIKVPAAPGGKLFLRLRDDTQAVAQIDTNL